MKRSDAIRLFFTGMALLVAAAYSGRAQSASGVETPAGTLKSVFNDQIGAGKDPFFPNSKRLERQKPVVRPMDKGTPKGGISDSIVLNGFSDAPNGKLAMINNRTFAVGEEYTLKCGKQSIKVKCVEIKDDGVVIEVDGSTKELKLRKGF